MLTAYLDDNYDDDDDDDDDYTYAADKSVKDCIKH